jgi:hypothetical protein
MEEPGEHSTVVFALIVTEPASEFACTHTSDTTVAGSVTILAKTTVHCSPGPSVICPIEQRKINAKTTVNCSPGSSMMHCFGV